MNLSKCLGILCFTTALFSTSVFSQAQAPENQKAGKGEQSSNLKKAARKGDAEAQYRLGKEALKSEDRAQGQRQAVAWFTKAAEQGHVGARYELGSRYRDGDGVERNYREAVKWLALAADQDHAQAWLKLGHCHADGGYGLFQDAGRADQCYRNADLKGNVEIWYELGTVYLHGSHSVAADWPRAFGFYNKAAERGHAYSAVEVGRCWEAGVGTPEDMSKALKWFKKAAELGEVYAIAHLGWCYEQGLGVAKDLKEAEAWYRKADERSANKEGSAHYSWGFRVRNDLQTGPELPADEATKDRPAADVEVSLATARKEYEAHEPILVTVTYRNVGKETYSFRRGGREAFRRHFIVTDARGRELPDPFQRPPGVVYGGGGIYSTYVLKPGQQKAFKYVLNQCVHFDTPGTYTISNWAGFALGSDAWAKEAEYRVAKVASLQIVIRPADKAKRAAAIAKLVQAYHKNEPLPEGFDGGDECWGGWLDALRFLVFYREPQLTPFFLDVLEQRTGSRAGGTSFAEVGLRTLSDRAAALRAFEERLAHPEKHNAPALLRWYHSLARPAHDVFAPSWDRRQWKRERETISRIHAGAVQLLERDKDHRYAYLVPDLLGGPHDSFLLNYLLRCKPSLDQIRRVASSMQRAALERAHIPFLVSLLEVQKDWAIADAAVLQLLRFDRQKFLPEMRKNLANFSPEVRRLVEEGQGKD